MPRKHLINRYLYREVLTTFLAVSVVLLLIFISGQLVSLFGKAASGSLQVGAILKTLGLKSISNLVFVLPLSFYISILLAFSRLYKDNEMFILAACGIGPWRILSTVLLLAVGFAIVAGWLSLQLAPWAESQSEVLVKQHQQRADIESLAAGRFKELTKGEGVVYVQEFDQDELKMKKVFMQHRVNGKNSIVSADSGYRDTDQKTGDRFLVLENGFRYEGPTEHGQTAIIKFVRHGIRLVEQPLQQIQFRQRAVPTTELLQRGTGPDHAEFQWRVSAVILSLVLAILAVPLSKTSPRQGRYAKLALALLIYIIYTNLLNVSRAWLNKGEVSVWVGLWWVHILVAILALALFIQWKPLVRKFWRGK